MCIRDSLYAALILPTTSALLSVLAGIDPRSYQLDSCGVAFDGTETVIGRFFANLTASGCIGTFFASPIVLNSLFLIFLVIASIALGYWWGGKRFVIPAIVFHVIFGLFYTSLFTNNAGWYSGCLLYTSPSPRDGLLSRMPSSA